MATIHKEIEIGRSKEFVWDAIRDVGAIHKRLVPGFVVDCKLESDWRIVTFANGIVVRELIISVDDKTYRHSWSARGEPLTHHNASVQVFRRAQNRSRVVWIADLMPNKVAGPLGNDSTGFKRNEKNARKQPGGSVILTKPYGNRRRLDFPHTFDRVCPSGAKLDMDQLI